MTEITFDHVFHGMRQLEDGSWICALWADPAPLTTEAAARLLEYAASYLRRERYGDQSWVTLVVYRGANDQLVFGAEFAYDEDYVQTYNPAYSNDAPPLYAEEEGQHV